MKELPGWLQLLTETGEWKALIQYILGSQQNLLSRKEILSDTFFRKINLSA